MLGQRGDIPAEMGAVVVWPSDRVHALSVARSAADPGRPSSGRAAARPLNPGGRYIV